MKGYLSILLVIGTIVLSLSGCASLASIPGISTGPQPGSIGYYQLGAIGQKATTETVSLRRLSDPMDAIFVYKSSDEVYFIGKGSNAEATKTLKPLTEASRGVGLNAEQVKKLKAYLESVVSSFNQSDKPDGTYLDFQLTNPGKDGKADTILLRLQYVYENAATGVEEYVLCFFGDMPESPPRHFTKGNMQKLIVNLNRLP